MTYSTWFEAHGQKHKNIMAKLEGLSDADVIAYFKFENMVEKEPDFCFLYKDNKKCHEMEDLNCYLCACPYFRFKDEGFSKEGSQVLYSTCSIESKDGAQFVSENAVHQDCSGCTVPHHDAYIKKYFSRDWFEIMRKVQNVKENQV
ncbi:MAG: hypothetical protein KC427_08705 [Sulfurovum sp.]|uniref:hypothetical protein n=1 Tax=Sulfurovum sp. TaxID=1969726 RepID=UPI0028680FDC|nr:hypothetical protein [Sulfurovum sp.]MCO4846082.1 hypothetical protein [Sulfurovum sp.]